MSEEAPLSESDQQGLTPEPALPNLSAPIGQNEPVPTTEREAYAQAISVDCSLVEIQGGAGSCSDKV